MMDIINKIIYIFKCKTNFFELLVVNIRYELSSQ